MDKQLQNRIRQMAGKSYTYRGETFQVQGVNVKSPEELIILTDQGDKPFSSEVVLKYFLADCKPAEMPAPAPTAEVMTVKPDEDIRSLTSILMQNIKQLQQLLLFLAPAFHIVVV